MGPAAGFLRSRVSFAGILIVNRVPCRIANTFISKIDNKLLTMLLLQQPSEATALNSLRASRRRRLNDSTTLHIYQKNSISPTPERKMPSKILPTGINDLPPEILFKVLAYLPSSDLARVARCCRRVSFQPIVDGRPPNRSFS